MNEFSRIYDLSMMTSFGKYEKIRATDEELKFLAKRLFIVSVDKFECDFTIDNEGVDERYSVDGKIHAKVTQACSVTLVPVQETIEEEVHIKIRIGEDLPNLEEDMDEEDDVEYLSQSKVDIGDLMVQYLALSLNPFPRAPGVSLEESAKASQSSPFSDLAKLKKT